MSICSAAISVVLLHAKWLAWIGTTSTYSHKNRSVASKAIVVEREDCTSAATWKSSAQRKLAEIWSPEGGATRRSGWNKFWSKINAMDKDFYESDEYFLKALVPRVPKHARVLQLGAGRSNIAERLFKMGEVASILSTDISAELVGELRKLYPPSVWTGLTFATVDSWNMKFPKKQQFDVVVEKAGIFDIQRENSGLLQRLLACIVTQAFEPSRGGLLIVMARVRDPPSNYPEGLTGVFSLRPEFNCTLKEQFSLEVPSYIQEADWDLKVLVAECGGVSHQLALSGCDAIWYRNEL